MKRSFAFLALVIVISSIFAGCSSDSDTFTMYRNSVIDRSMRIHVATFNAAVGGDKYNSGNCDLAASLFASQDGVKTRFWCEKGTYKK